jgi:hypothetical protein
MFFGNLNYITIIVATIIGTAVGALWYTPYTFGPLWLKTKVWTDEHMKAKKHGKSMVRVHTLQFFGTLAIAVVLAGLFNSLIVTGITGILFTGFCVWIGFSVPTKLVDYLFGGDSLAFFLISIGHELATILAMSVVIGIFG